MAYFENPYKFDIYPPNKDLTVPWVVVDTETGGLDPREHRLLSIAFFFPETQKVEAFLIKDSKGTCTKKALEINGLDVEKCEAEGITCEEAREKFEEFTEGKAIVGHNIAFDLGFISFHLFGIRPHSKKMAYWDEKILIDTLERFRSLHSKTEVPSAALSSVASFYGIRMSMHAEDAEEDEEEDKDFHDAGFDAGMTGVVLMQELKELRARVELAKQREIELQIQQEQKEADDAARNKMLAWIIGIIVVIVAIAGALGKLKR